MRAQAQAQARAQRAAEAAEEEGGLTDSPPDEESEPRCLICLNDLQVVSSARVSSAIVSRALVNRAASAA